MSQTPIYTTPSLSVFQATTSEGHPRRISIHHYSSVLAATTASTRLQSSLSLDHPYIDRVYEVVSKEREVQVEAEWSGEDLTRLVQGYEWTQDECWGLLCCVVSALGYAQSLGIAHGAVLPGSICKTDLGVFKLAGFQCPERQRSGESLWGVREPFYLCPDLRKAYARLLTGEDAGEIDCNVYKSDVYSTGLTLISLLTPSALPRLGNSAAASLCISSLPLHPQFQSVIRSMLEADARNRPDWQELEQIMRQVQGSESHEEEVKAEPAATEKKKRLKIVRKQPGLSEKPAESDSPSPAESSTKICPRCRRDFIDVTFVYKTIYRKI